MELDLLPSVYRFRCGKDTDGRFTSLRRCDLYIRFRSAISHIRCGNLYQLIFRITFLDLQAICDRNGCCAQVLLSISDTRRIVANSCHLTSGDRNMHWI